MDARKKKKKQKKKNKKKKKKKTVHALVTGCQIFYRKTDGKNTVHVDLSLLGEHAIL